MLTVALTILIVFYAGAVVANGRSWIAVWRGAIRFPALRDLTGIGDRAVLRRRFGLMRADGAYQVTLTDVLRHRRPAGVILTDLPVHLLFLAALVWAAFHDASPAALGIVSAAFAHALLLGFISVAVLAGSRQPLAD